MAKRSYYFEMHERMRENPKEFIEMLKIKNPVLKMYVYNEYYLGKLMDKLYKKMCDIVKSISNKSKATKNDKDCGEHSAVTRQVNELHDIQKHKDIYKAKSIRKDVRKSNNFKSTETKPRRRL